MDRYPLHGWRSRHYLPHLDFEGTLQHVIFDLADALPDSQTGSAKVLESTLDADLDRGHGKCLLADPRCAAIVQDELLRLDVERYRLLAWCVMPNHVHVVIEQKLDLAGTVRRWKSWTAREINSLLGRASVAAGIFRPLRAQRKAPADDDQLCRSQPCRRRTCGGAFRLALVVGGLCAIC